MTTTRTGPIDLRRRKRTTRTKQIILRLEPAIARQIKDRCAALEVTLAQLIEAATTNWNLEVVSPTDDPHQLHYNSAERSNQLKRNVQVGFRVDPTFAAELYRLAAQHGMHVSEFVTLAVLLYFRRIDDKARAGQPLRNEDAADAADVPHDPTEAYWHKMPELYRKNREYITARLLDPDYVTLLRKMGFVEEDFKIISQILRRRKYSELKITRALAALLKALQEEPYRNPYPAGLIFNAYEEARNRAKELPWANAKSHRRADGKREFKNIADFVAKRYGDLIERGMTRNIFRQIEPEAYNTFSVWCNQRRVDPNSILPMRAREAPEDVIGQLAPLHPKDLLRLRRAFRTLDSRDRRSHNKALKDDPSP